MTLCRNLLFFPTVDPPHITQDLVTQTVTTGADKELSITATGDKLKFQWQKDGQRIENKPRFFPSHTTGTLRIKSVEKSDKGQYKCLVSNPVANSEKSSSEAELKVCKFLVCG